MKLKEELAKGEPLSMSKMKEITSSEFYVDSHNEKLVENFINEQKEEARKFNERISNTKIPLREVLNSKSSEQATIDKIKSMEFSQIQEYPNQMASMMSVQQSDLDTSKVLFMPLDTEETGIMT